MTAKRIMLSETWIVVLVLLSVELHAVASQNSNCIDRSKATAVCTEGCTSGHRGPFCNETCSENCAGACSQDTGHCLTGCKPNWFTLNCSEPCSGNCVDDICDMKSGECLRGCRNGFHGLFCNKPCSENCTGGFCDIYGGCSCKDGITDKACYINCDRNCIGGLCAVDRDGQLKCLNGCKKGRMGNFCKEWCPFDCPNCDPSCSANEMNSRNKRQVDRCGDEGRKCKDGYRGKYCNITCQACRYSENCTLHCAGGSWGEECQIKCPDNCSRATNGRSGCDQSGYCHSGCLQQYYGYTCDRKCPETCEGRYCFMNNGSCSNGCRHEYWGPKCEKRCGHCVDLKCERDGSCTCVDGYYGRRCEHNCSSHCKSGNCSLNSNGSHICNGDCVLGYAGLDCLSHCPSACKDCNREEGTCESSGSKKDSLSPVATAFIVIAVFFAVLSVILGLILYFKCRQRSRTSMKYKYKKKLTAPTQETKSDERPHVQPEREEYVERLVEVHLSEEGENDIHAVQT